MACVFNVADWFLWRNEETIDDGDVELELLTHLKLQKLLYYAQGCYLALYKEKLFDAPILAWNHGPVVKEVYDKYSTLENGEKRGSHGIKSNPFYENNFAEKEEKVLNFVFQEFGQYSAWTLRNMTHEERPWKSTNHNEEIPIEIMQDYFEKEYLSDE